MKKLSLVLVVLFFVSIVAYGAGWTDDGTVVRLTTSSDTVGIGTSSPIEQLTTTSNALIGHNGYPAIYLRDNYWWSGLLDGSESTWGDKGSYVINIHQHNQVNRYFVIQSKSSQGRGAGNPLLLIESYTGYVGIGTTSPDCKLDVAGTAKMNSFKLPTGAANNYVLTSDADGVGTWQSIPLKWLESGVSDIYFTGGNVGIGTSSPVEELDVVGTVKMDSFKLPTGAADGYILTSDGSGVGTWQSMPLQWFGSGNDIYYNTGNVCVGTDIPESELTVDGTITTREMKVQLTGWPDFVFEDNYKLMSLNKLEKHIKKERNLPGIPTNKEVVKEGIYVGEMQAKLLEKVEELTLYVIELNKEVGDLRKENEDLREKISTLVK